MSIRTHRLKNSINFVHYSQFYETLSKSLKKVVLQRIAMAKRPDTRRKRIAEATQAMALNKKPVA